MTAIYPHPSSPIRDLVVVGVLLWVWALGMYLAGRALYRRASDFKRRRCIQRLLTDDAEPLPNEDRRWLIDEMRKYGGKYYRVKP